MTPFDPKEPITVTLEAQQWNVVIGAVMDVPWRIADPVLRSITSQTKKKPDEDATTDDQVAPHKGNGADAQAAA